MTHEERAIHAIEQAAYIAEHYLVGDDLLHYKGTHRELQRRIVEALVAVEREVTERFTRTTEYLP